MSVGSLPLSNMQLTSLPYAAPQRMEGTNSPVGHEIPYLHRVPQIEEGRSLDVDNAAVRDALEGQCVIHLGKVVNAGACRSNQCHNVDQFGRAHNEGASQIFSSGEVAYLCWDIETH